MRVAVRQTREPTEAIANHVLHGTHPEVDIRKCIFTVWLVSVNTNVEMGSRSLGQGLHNWKSHSLNVSYFSASGGQHVQVESRHGARANGNVEDVAVSSSLPRLLISVSSSGGCCRFLNRSVDFHWIKFHRVRFRRILHVILNSGEAAAAHTRPDRAVVLAGLVDTVLGVWDAGTSGCTASSLVLLPNLSCDLSGNAWIICHRTK